MWSNAYDNKYHLRRLTDKSGCRRGEMLDPVATCTKICRICGYFFKTDAHAQKDCDTCKDKIKSGVIKPYGKI